MTLPKPPSPLPKRYINESEATQAPQKIVDHLVDTYFAYGSQCMLHIVNEGRFRRNRHGHSKLLINALCGFASRWATHPEVVNGAGGALYNAGESFYRRARKLAMLEDEPSIETTIALVLLTSCASGRGKSSASYLFAGMALRMATNLKLDAHPDSHEVVSQFGPLTWFEKEVRRRLWCTCWGMDLTTSVASGRDMFFEEKVFEGYVERGVWAIGEDGQSERLGRMDEGKGEGWVKMEDGVETGKELMLGKGTNVAGRCTDVTWEYRARLVLLFARVINHVNASNKQPATPAGIIPPTPADTIISRIDALENALLGWKRSLTPFLQFFDPPVTMYHFDPALYDVAYMHLMYNAAMVLLHKPKFKEIMKHFADGAIDEATLVNDRHFVASRLHAEEAAETLRRVLKSNPDMNWMTPFVLFFTFQPAIIHVTIAKQLPQEAPKLVELAKVHLRALQGLSKAWAVGGQLRDMLGGMLAKAGLMGMQRSL
ncbi:hypothetical protein HDV00_004036 [Rhizophlyctis rosea]|nr:hypothetical protein HDV00_004036 [Rhizophlyctis rosea]